MSQEGLGNRNILPYSHSRYYNLCDTFTSTTLLNLFTETQAEQNLQMYNGSLNPKAGVKSLLPSRFPVKVKGEGAWLMGTTE